MREGGDALMKAGSSKASPLRGGNVSIESGACLDGIGGEAQLLARSSESKGGGSPELHWAGNTLLERQDSWALARGAMM